MSTDNGKGGPLAGLKILELAGIGPAPLCCSLMSDLGANVLRIDRNADAGLGIGRDRRTDLTPPRAKIRLSRSETFERSGDDLEVGRGSGRVGRPVSSGRD